MKQVIQSDFLGLGILKTSSQNICSQDFDVHF